MQPLTIDLPEATGQDLPAATGTPRAFTRRWPYFAGAGLTLTLVVAPVAAAAAVMIATRLHLATGGVPGMGDWAALTAGMIFHPGQPGQWGTGGAGVTRPGAVVGIAAALWAAVLLVARLGPDHPCPSTASRRCGPAVGSGPFANQGDRRLGARRPARSPICRCGRWPPPGG